MKFCCKKKRRWFLNKYLQKETIVSDVCFRTQNERGVTFLIGQLLSWWRFLLSVIWEILKKSNHLFCQSRRLPSLKRKWRHLMLMLALFKCIKPNGYFTVRKMKNIKSCILYTLLTCARWRCCCITSCVTWWTSTRAWPGTNITIIILISTTPLPPPLTSSLSSPLSSAPDV